MLSSILSDSKTIKEILMNRRIPTHLHGAENYLSFVPLLSKQKPDEELYLYLTVSLAVISTVLVHEQDKI